MYCVTANTGLGNLIAKDEEEYVQLAVQLASDITSLSNLRMSLRDLMARSPVCDGPNFTLGLESAYRNMWRRYCKGDVPSQRHMEILQQELTTEEPAYEPVRITTSVAGSPGSIKSNGFNPLPTPMLNPSSCEENGV